MDKYLQIAQAIISIVLIVVILMQQRGTAMGSAFGGSGESYSTRRGVQKKLLIVTIILGTIFISLTLLNLLF